MFQFPSNGKAYPKKTQILTGVAAFVRFNSLQTGKRIQRLSSVFNPDAYLVSIPFKRESVSKVFHGNWRKGMPRTFQFPSNGKAYPKRNLTPREGVAAILFQFPSNGKAYPKQDTSHGSASSVWFQFPSNGKAYPKS